MVIGGSSAINGMVFMRGNVAEYDHWEELGNLGWNWDGLFPYFKNSEHFTPAHEKEVEEWEIEYDDKAHGERGFVENGYPNFVWPSTRNFLNAFLELGVSYLKDSLSGLNTGGVGENYQDHLLFVTFGPAPDVEVQYGNLSTNVTWASEMRKLYDEKREGPFTTTSANVFSFLPLAKILNGTSSDYIESLPPLLQSINSSQYLPPSTPASVLAGYKLQHKILTSNLLATDTAHMEMIVGDSIIAPALQLPLSRGCVSISSTSAFDPPLLNLNYLSHPIDLL
ncbi:hypothetical protein DID88_007444 [Monilinia fructigena]|uniref:Glucose-methanol-choline oxidoreductase N-terminal domain-containing protein n=1 Tax=Monilinia fructigena TaxID=38457 RepID=A0A395JDD6_9HELO|nr:hypothetical protein DID88_007444 [Monilinia fructigena]